MQTNQKKFSRSILFLLVAVCLVCASGFYLYKLHSNRGVANKTSDTVSEETNTDPKLCTSTQCEALESEYNDLRNKYSLKYKTFSSAAIAFRQDTNPNMYVDKIATRVPGKLPREDGNPYFIGKGVIDEESNKCIVGYVNLVTGVTESHQDACVVD